MDKMSSAGWKWEFIRRSKDYREFYKKWIKSLHESVEGKNADDYYRKLFAEYSEEYSPTFPDNPDHKWALHMLLPDGKTTKLLPIRTTSLGVGFGVDASGENVSSPQSAERGL
jgi:hypothetical protein